MTELTDSTNIAKGFSLMPIAWSVGATIGLIRKALLKFYTN